MLPPTPLAPLVSIVIPTLNESGNIERLIQRIADLPLPFPYEIIVVDDGSTDGTAQKVIPLKQSRPVRLLERRDERDGLAGAVLAGARAAAADTIVVMDADLSHPPEDLPQLAQPVLEGSADIVIGSRYIAGGVTPGWPLRRRFISRVASALAWPLTDVQDSLSGFFAAQKELLLQIPPGAAGFKITLELLVRGGETLRVREVPIVFRDRTAGASKMGARVILTYLQRLFALSGGQSPAQGARNLVERNLPGWLADAALFLGACALGVQPGTAHLASYCAGALLGFFDGVMGGRRPLIPRACGA